MYTKEINEKVKDIEDKINQLIDGLQTTLKLHKEEYSTKQHHRILLGKLHIAKDVLELGD